MRVANTAQHSNRHRVDHAGGGVFQQKLHAGIGVIRDIEALAAGGQKTGGDCENRTAQTGSGPLGAGFDQCDPVQAQGILGGNAAIGGVQ